MMVKLSEVVVQVRFLAEDGSPAKVDVSYDLPRETVSILQELANDTRRYDIGGLIEWIAWEMFNRMGILQKPFRVNSEDDINRRTIECEHPGGEQ